MKRSAAGGASNNDDNDKASTASSNNAFALLMSGKKKSVKKKRPLTPTVFVACPMGCGKRFPEYEINTHLDRCSGGKSLSSEATKVSSTPPHTANESSQTKQHPAITNDQVKENEMNEKGTASSSSPKEASSNRPNAFAHMMERSSQVFAESTEPQRLCQRLHLTKDGTVQLFCYSLGSDGYAAVGFDSTAIKWSATAQLRDRDPETNVTSTIDLIVSSAIPSGSAEQRPRLVKRHSRLSVPVLKSIFQKSIRRRKPLPSVRVALELMDKSMGDMLRRLPIIIVEDSSLHPDLPLLIWLMVAHSKDFEIPRMLIERILKIIYEVASCPWKDSIPRASQSFSLAGTRKTVSTFHSVSQQADTVEDSDTLIWSILVRAAYGGMGGDIQMLRGFAALWDTRFSSGEIPKNVASVREDEGDVVTWNQIPTLIHNAASQQSLARVRSLAQQGIPYLTLNDISVEGIDFHCSPILENILSDRFLVEQCIDKIRPSRDIPVATADRRSFLEGRLKSWIWDYSAGVNRRRPLVPSQSGAAADENDAEIKSIWTEFLHPKVKNFQEGYTRNRLAS